MTGIGGSQLQFEKCKSKEVAHSGLMDVEVEHSKAKIKTKLSNMVYKWYRVSSKCWKTKKVLRISSLQRTVS